MKKATAILLIILFSVFFTCGCGPEYPDDGLPDDPPDPVVVNILENQTLSCQYIRWIGRTFYDDAKQSMCIYYTAAGFEVYFTGTLLKVSFTATNTNNKNNRPFFTASVDDEIAPDGIVFSLSSAKQDVTVAEGLPYGEHKIKLLKMSEPEDSETAITAIETDGEFLIANMSDTLRIQYLGGSGLSGHGALGSKGQRRTTANSSSLHSFAYLSARMLDADFQYVSNSGMGLIWGFINTNLQDAYQYAGLSVSVMPAGGQWDHENWIPDVIVINIGGNDFDSYVLKQVDQSAAKKIFSEAVTSFITYLVQLYSDVKIVWTHTGSQNGIIASSAIRDMSLAIRSQVKVVIIPKVGSDGDAEGANGHNNVVTHIRTADIITDTIAGWLNISKTRVNII